MGVKILTDGENENKNGKREREGSKGSKRNTTH